MRNDRNRDNHEVGSERAVSEKVFQLLRGEEDAGGQREGLRLWDLRCWVGVKQLVMVE